MELNTRRPLTTLLALPVALGFLAVGACAPDEEVEEMDTEAPVITPEPTAPAAPVSINLTSIEGSSVMGSATATHRDNEIELSLALDGLMEDVEYTARVLTGACPTTTGTEPEAETGNEIAEFELEVTGMNATGSETIDAGEFGTGSDTHIAVTDDEDRLVACGDIVGLDATMQGTSPGSTPPGGTPQPEGYQD